MGAESVCENIYRIGFAVNLLFGLENSIIKVEVP